MCFSLWLGIGYFVFKFSKKFFPHFGKFVALLKVIPLKLFCYQTFLKLGIVNIHDMTIKKCNKKMGSPYLFMHQQALKMEYFYRLRVKNSNHRHTELSLDYLKDTKFFHESKAFYSHK